jgi:alpha-glucosidase (family GH31 glycosyl hydrolase)
VFSPVNRLHSGLNPFNTKEPWRFSADAERVMKDFLRLRHQLLPYLATMNVRAHEGEPLVSPMYYDHPDDPEAYTVPNQFMFGTELLVAPVTTPADRSTRLARVKAWLPEGEWVDLFTGLRYTGGRTIYLHRPLDTIPVLARAGAVLPVVPEDAVAGGTDLSERIEVRAVAGADGEFTLVEDRDDGRFARTRLSYVDRTRELVVHDVEGEASTLPDGRSYELVVVGAEADDVPARVFAILDRAQMDFVLKAAVLDVVRHAASPAHAALALQGLDLDEPLLGAVSEVLLARP